MQTQDDAKGWNLVRLARQAWDGAGMFLVFALMFAALSLWVPYFFSIQNMIGLALSVSMVGMVACTMLFCMASGDFDLSVEGTVVLAGVLCAVVMNATHSITLGILAGLAGGAVVGFINGAVIAKLKINALITTLAMLYIVRGISFIASNGSAVGIAEERFFELGNGALFEIPNPIWITAALFVFFAILLNRTTFGRDTLAIGGNKEAARLAGIPVDRVKIIIFTMQGLVAGAAGIILASRMTSGQPNSSVGFALDVISACVLGGVSLTGGIGTIPGALVGVLIMGTLQNAMNLMNIPTFYQYVAKGGILLAAVLLDQVKQAKK
jgi:L-arabinose transport system permease protein